eukprot:CAMPEP_0174738666 /NCGR_PEP_ID=MMETSP1094-20130205/70325_1 /TAXON_ID=156173 /ORGANISM="Chrysochromulina brevifilum, Strain UTEX LB 985" /LENGTH=149 /DNA_ID=CAMNT_0015942123 /DNA_START=55 /DNA_END=504 /DNA_ORIENTATION=+
MPTQVIDFGPTPLFPAALQHVGKYSLSPESLYEARVAVPHHATASYSTPSSIQQAPQMLPCAPSSVANVNVDQTFACTFFGSCLCIDQRCNQAFSASPPSCSTVSLKQESLQRNGERIEVLTVAESLLELAASDGSSDSASSISDMSEE